MQSAAQIELLETRVRFEAYGSSRREVHARVRINTESGTRQFTRLTFDYNRAFEQIELPLVRITHPSGGTADILPSAITDQPNPAVADAPAYHDVRRKSVRIPGLAPGDVLEYRVVTTVSHHPLAPDFWLEHLFARGNTVAQEVYEVDLPASRRVQIQVNPATPATIEKSGEGDSARDIYRWQRDASKTSEGPRQDTAQTSPDLVVTSFSEWPKLASGLQRALTYSVIPPEIASKSRELTSAVATPVQSLQILYDYVSQKIRTIDLPLGATGFRLRNPVEVMSSGYAIPEEKCALLSALLHEFAVPVLVLSEKSPWEKSPRPTLFSKVLVKTVIGDPTKSLWLDPAAEVAPLGMISSALRGKLAISMTSHSSGLFETVSLDLPFAASQRVNVHASISSAGRLTAKVKYTMRGDNELLLRMAFHKQPREKWNDVAQLLSLSDGFRGQVTNVTASDPYATKDPFSVEYEISQPNFVDWKKQPVRIPALLPSLGLPDLPANTANGGAAGSAIELGTPLDVETHVTLHLPQGTTVRAPVGTSVERDYATFSSRYATRGMTATASRHLKFILRELPVARAADYSAFVRAVQNDEAQEFVFERIEPAPKFSPSKP